MVLSGVVLWFRDHVNRTLSLKSFEANLSIGHHRRCSALLLLLVRNILACLALSSLAVGQAKPSTAPIRPVQDTYFGQTMIDPYRWLED